VDIILGERLKAFAMRGVRGWILKEFTAVGRQKAHVEARDHGEHIKESNYWKSVMQ
jgi:hypothetical protein